LPPLRRRDVEDNRPGAPPRYAEPVTPRGASSTRRRHVTPRGASSTRRRQEPKPTAESPTAVSTSPTVPGPPRPQPELRATKEFLPDHSNPAGDHHSGLPTILPHCRSPSPRTSPPGEPPPLNRPKSSPSPYCLAPRTLPTTPSYRQSPDSGWRPPPGEADAFPLFFVLGPKVPSGMDHFLGRVGRVIVGAAHCNSGVSLLYFGLIQNSIQI
jgi:hypothetical protein